MCACACALYYKEWCANKERIIIFKRIREGFNMGNVPKKDFQNIYKFLVELTQPPTPENNPLFY